MKPTKYPTKPHDEPLKGHRRNGAVVVVNGITKVKKHEPYARAKLAAPKLNYKLPTGGYR